MLVKGSFIARTVALGLLAALLLVANQFAVQPLLQAHRDNQAKIDSSRELLQRYQALAAEKPRLANQLASLESAVETSMAYLDGASDALATAALQDRVADAIDMAGGDIKSLRSLPTVDVEERPDLRRTGVQVRFATDIDSLAEALHDLETMEPLLAIDRLEIVAAAKRRTKNDALEAPKLDVRADVYGYARLQE